MDFTAIINNIPNPQPADSLPKPPVEKKYQARAGALLMIRERLVKDKKISQGVHEKVMTLEKHFNTETKLLDTFAQSLLAAKTRERSLKLQSVMNEYLNQTRERILDIGKAISQLRVTIASQLLSIGNDKELIDALSDFENTMKRNIKSKSPAELESEETKRKTKAMYEAWERYLRHRGTALQEYCLYLSNLFMFLHSRNLTGCHLILELLKDLDPKSEMLVASPHQATVASKWIELPHVQTSQLPLAVEPGKPAGNSVLGSAMQTPVVTALQPNPQPAARK